MRRSQRRIAKAVDSLTGRQDCTDVLILERRPRWVVPLGFLVWTVAWIGLGSILEDAISGGLGGLVAYLILAPANQRFVLAKCGDTLVVAALRTYSRKPQKVLHEVEPPADRFVGEGLVLKKVRLAGETYLLSRSLVTQFQAMTRP